MAEHSHLCNAGKFDRGCPACLESPHGYRHTLAETKPTTTCPDPQGCRADGVPEDCRWCAPAVEPDPALEGEVYPVAGFDVRNDAPAVEPDVIVDARQDMRAASPERTPHGEGCLCTPCRVEKWNREHGIEPEQPTCLCGERPPGVPHMSQCPTRWPEQPTLKVTGDEWRDIMANPNLEKPEQPADPPLTTDEVFAMVEPEQPTCGECGGSGVYSGMNSRRWPCGCQGKTTTPTRDTTVDEMVNEAVEDERARIERILRDGHGTNGEAIYPVAIINVNGEPFANVDDLLAAIRGGDDA